VRRLSRYSPGARWPRPPLNLLRCAQVQKSASHYTEAAFDEITILQQVRGAALLRWQPVLALTPAASGRSLKATRAATSAWCGCLTRSRT
jgi:hypothetical protein